VERERAHAQRQAFQTSAADVSGTLETQLRRDTDFVRSVRAVLALQPNLSASGFRGGSRCSKKNANSRPATAR
jgi:hypothetical protein